jgi:glycosyltransferase involved in cell wall biosynthesis
MLTIGLPFYNNEKTLTDAVKSVLLQTYSDWELILSDDGSKDRSLEIANEFALKDKRIKVITDGVNKGLSFRLNQIAELASCEYLARMDADDMMMPQKLEKQMTALLKDRSIDIIDTVAYIINEKEVPIGIRGSWDISTWDKRKVLTKGLLFHPTVIAKTSWFRQNKYNVSDDFYRSEDLELWCRTFETTVFSRIYEPLFIYREGKVNIKNYTASAMATRNILRIHRNVISNREFYLEIVKSYIKSGLYRTFALFEIHNILSSTRNYKLDDVQKLKVSQAIKQIKNGI